ncbi:Rieske (2Fe-2S) protein [Dendronalium phyllosphericum]|uniref:Rieske (2Fe-2S) protein n=1 Tax=Dendronalium phyllosphericum TaxID=2840445 RepID=UPI001CEC6C10|nr:Rieske (2Fe-2S) protein [Dendronalium phyllosphericum]
MQFADFWYIVALSKQLRPNTVLARTVLGEWLAVFRGEDGQAVALRDHFIHALAIFSISPGAITNLSH